MGPKISPKNGAAGPWPHRVADGARASRRWPARCRREQHQAASHRGAVRSRSRRGPVARSRRRYQHSRSPQLTAPAAAQQCQPGHGRSRPPCALRRAHRRRSRPPSTRLHQRHRQKQLPRSAHAGPAQPGRLAVLTQASTAWQERQPAEHAPGPAQAGPRSRQRRPRRGNLAGTVASIQAGQPELLPKVRKTDALSSPNICDVLPPSLLIGHQ